MNRFQRRAKALNRQQLSSTEFEELRHTLARDKAWVKECLKEEKRKIAAMTPAERAQYVKMREEESAFNWDVFTGVMGAMGRLEHHDTTQRSVIKSFREAPLAVPEGRSVSEAFAHSLHQSQMLDELEGQLPIPMRSKR